MIPTDDPRVRLTANLCLTAGAGAGKTYRLVQTYLALLEGWPGQSPLKPEHIAAITFTEKAAAEMRARVVGAVAERAAGDMTPGASHWQALIPALEWAPISTIHSFCAQLLREFGTVLGLDPDFRILDADAHNQLLDEAAAGLFRQLLKAKDSLLNQVIKHHDLAGMNGLQSLLPEYHHKLATLGISAGQALDNTSMSHEAAKQAALDRLPELLAVVEEILDGFAGDSKVRDSKAQYAQTLRDMAVVWPELRNQLLGDPLQETLIEQLSAFFKIRIKGFDAAKQSGKEIIEALQAAAATPPAEALSVAMLSLLERFDEVVEQEKKRRSSLSFDDLLSLTSRLLQDHPAVLDELRGRFPILMVDEYQDVNPAQGRLVGLLAGLGEPDPGGRVRLLAVGDRKQSIYGFRGAEVSVFSGLMSGFDQGGGQVEALPCNYRSDPGLVAFFNRLFPAVFAESAPENVTELASFVQFIDKDLQEPGGIVQESPRAGLEVLDCRDMTEQNLPLAAWRVVEAERLGLHLSGTVRRGLAEPGEIVLLFRRLTQVGIYEDGLRKAGLDYYTVRGRGFYACQEISDLAQALKAVLHPDDAPALAAFLRSPLVGLDDQSLLALARREPQGAPDLVGGFAAGELPEWAGPEQAHRLAAAQRVLAALRPLARRLAPVELLDALLEELDLTPLMLGLEGGEQRAANMRKLLETARAARGGLGPDVESFVQGLNRLVAEPPQDAQAPLMGEQASVIRLMSVHQAKGLEFPVVVLADLAGNPPAPGAIPDLGPGGELADAPWDAGRGVKLRSSLHLRLRQRDIQRQAAEEARLFYVACTRASRRLVFCLNGAAPRWQGRWSRWVSETVLPDPATTLVDARTLTQTGDVATSAIAITWPDRLPPDPGPLAAEGAALVRSCMEPRPAPVSLVRESVSGLEDWLTCPRRYLLTRRLGLDTAGLPRRGGAPAESASGASLGSAVHQTLETADLWAGPPVDEHSQARRRATGLWDTEVPGLLAGLAPEQVFREHGFLLRLEGGAGEPSLLVRGEIDLLFPAPDGRLVVVDYKVTDHVEPEAYRDQLMIYGLAAQRAAGPEAPPPRLLICWLTSSGGRQSEIAVTADDLDRMAARLLEAARGIAALGASDDPTMLPMAPDCRRAACSLARLCPEAAP